MHARGQILVVYNLEKLSKNPTDLEPMNSTSTTLDAIIETSIDAFIGMDDQGRVTHWNHAAVLTFGWAKSEAIGIHLVVDGLSIVQQVVVYTASHSIHTVNRVREFFANVQKFVDA